MIQYIRIQNFRSVRDIALELGPLNIVFGPNGCGKSNIYNAIHLLTAAADGKLSGFISEEGGLENMMWSGERSPVDRHPRRLQIACRTDSFDYELQIGFPEKLPYPTQFMLDPIVKEENIWLAGYSRRPSSRVLQRKNQAAFLVDVTGEKSTFTESIYENESVFGQLGEPHRFPEVSRVRETLRRWRFYHEPAIRRCVSRPWDTVRQCSTAMAIIWRPPFRPLSKLARKRFCTRSSPTPFLAASFTVKTSSHVSP